MRFPAWRTHYKIVGPSEHSFAEEAARLIREGEKDVVEALCSLSKVQSAFTHETGELNCRIARLSPPRAFLNEPHGLSLRDRTLSLLWLLFAGLACAAFAAGFWLGRHAQ